MDPRYFVIGNPISHSLSPLIHNMALKELGLPGTYEARQVTEEELEGFFRDFRETPFAGCNITLPHKVAARACVDRVTERANKVGAINTVYREKDRLIGENTDVPGFTQPLEGRTIGKALILGGGGVARAALVGLAELGVKDAAIANRTEEKARALVDAFRDETDFRVTLVPWEERHEGTYDLVVNATSLGMKGPLEDKTPFERFTGRGLAYDIVYTPEETRFLREAREAGWEAINGVAMFVGQAVEAFRLWTGREMPREKAMAAVREALAKRGQDPKKGSRKPS